MSEWFQHTARAIRDRLGTWRAHILQPVGTAIDAWLEQRFAPMRPAAEQMLAADAVLFETLSLETQPLVGPLGRALFRARVLAQLEFFTERAVYKATAASGSADLVAPVIRALGAQPPLSRADFVRHVDTAAPRALLAAWHACLRARHPDVETMAELDRRATQAVLDALAGWRGKQAQETGAAQAQVRMTTGIALSGGGIRSASFALGALQELAQRRLLYGIDYMSAVSGGGYAASWLTTWAYRHRAGIRGVEDEFALRTATPAPLRWIRRYGVYLAPRFGIFAPDLWSLGVTYLRNSLPILCITVPLLAAIMAFPHTPLAFTETFTEAALPSTADGDGGLAWALVLSIVPYLIALMLLRRYTLFTVGGYTAELGNTVPTLMAAFAVVGGWLTAIGLAELARHAGVSVAAWMFIAASVVMQAGSSLAAPDQARNDRMAQARPMPRGSLWRLASATLAAGLLAGVGFYAAYRFLAGMPAASLVAVGPLAILLAIGLGEIAFATVMTPISDDADRAWWSRAAAFALLPTVVWMLVCAIAFAPSGLTGTGEQLVALVHGGWWLGGTSAAIIATGAVLLASTRIRALVRTWLPHALLVVAALAILGAIAWGTDAVLRGFPDAFAAIGITGPGPTLSAAAVTVAFFLVAALASMAVNLNRSSLHGLYRDALIRTFLGASRRSPYNEDLEAPASPLGIHGAEVRQWKEREAEHFTDIDDDDNPALAWLRPGTQRKFPLLLVNASLNGVMPGRRSGHEARQYPFTFGPIHCGSPAPGVGYGWTTRFFRASKMDKKLTLGTAMAVSGAAVSPNPGRTGSSLLSFLLTMVNARLGLWIGNPRYRGTPGQTSPGFGLPYVARELFGLRKLDWWIQLSDGGHFENIGLHELLRRRCGRIIVIDASCDPGRAFADIGDAIRRARIDLNVDIRATAQWRIGEPELGAKGQEWAMFEIVYPGDTRGRMLYIKPSLYDDSASALPMDVLDYWSRHAEFPHETTANQFFSEAQLEAYRSLGRFCTGRALQAVLADPAEATWTQWVATTQIERTLAGTMARVPPTPTAGGVPPCPPAGGAPPAPPTGGAPPSPNP